MKKKIYVRLATHSGYKFEDAIVYFEYSDYGVAITRAEWQSRYHITDIRTGVGAGKSFRLLREAREFLEDNLDEFTDWYLKLEKIRKLESYDKLVEEKEAHINAKRP